MFMFTVDNNQVRSFWLHDPASSAPAGLKPQPDKKSLMAAWAQSRLGEEQRTDVDLRKNPPRPFYPLQLVLAVYPSKS